MHVGYEWEGIKDSRSSGKRGNFCLFFAEFDSGMGNPGPSLHSLPAREVLQNAPPLNECRTSKGTFQVLLRSVGLIQFLYMLRVCGLIGAEILMNKAVLS